MTQLESIQVGAEVSKAKKRALIICAKRYNGHELWTLLGVLQNRGHNFEVVSSETLIKDELTLQPNVLARTLYEVPTTECSAFDALCVVSGNMADTEAYWSDDGVLKLLLEFFKLDKVIAAICCSVPTVAPIANGKQVSPFPLLRSKKRLLEYGAILVPVSLAVDGKLVTAENQMMTQMWAGEICNLLEGKPPTFNLRDSGFVPKGRERKMSPEVRYAIDTARARQAASQTKE